MPVRNQTQTRSLSVFLTVVALVFPNSHIFYGSRAKAQLGLRGVCGSNTYRSLQVHWRFRRFALPENFKEYVCCTKSQFYVRIGKLFSNRVNPNRDPIFSQQLPHA